MTWTTICTFPLIVIFWVTCLVTFSEVTSNVFLVTLTVVYLVT